MQRVCLVELHITLSSPMHASSASPPPPTLSSASPPNACARACFRVKEHRELGPTYASMSTSLGPVFSTNALCPDNARAHLCVERWCRSTAIALESTFASRDSVGSCPSSPFAYVEGIFTLGPWI
jgi:hypothetical protein